MSAILDPWRERLADWGVAVLKSEERPWGGFLVLDTEQAMGAPELWPSPPVLERHEAYSEAKVLIIRDLLSVQYHARRREVWRVLEGEGMMVYEPTPLPKPEMPAEIGPLKMTPLQPGTILHIPCWSVHEPLPSRRQDLAVAEIWIHHPHRPTAEADIIRPFDPWARRNEDGAGEG